MTKEINSLESVFQSEAFRIFAPYFLEKPRIALDVEEKSGVSRQTILKQFSKIEQYIEVPNKWSPKVKGKPFKLKSAIISDYLGQKLGLDEDQKSTLKSIVENEKINPIIIKGNETIETAITKTILTVLLIGVLRYHIADDTKTSLAFVDSLFGNFLGGKIFPDKKTRNQKAVEQKVQILTPESFKFVYSNLAESEEEFKNYESELKKIAKDGNDRKFDKIDILVQRIRDSKISITTSPNIWYDVLGFTIEPSLHYTEYIRGKYKRDLSHIKKHGTREEKRTLKAIEKQMNEVKK